MKERYRTLSAVMLMLMRENNGVEEILLQKRKNTGYMDGYWDCSASGHVENMESMKMAMQREAKEELSIDIDIEDLEFVSLIHKINGVDTIYYNGSRWGQYIFKTFLYPPYIDDRPGPTPTPSGPSKKRFPWVIYLRNIRKR